MADSERTRICEVCKDSSSKIYHNDTWFCRDCYSQWFLEQEHNCKYKLANGRLLRKLDSEEFYDLMQYYRHIPVSEQPEVGKAFEAVKDFIKKELST